MAGKPKAGGGAADEEHKMSIAVTDSITNATLPHARPLLLPARKSLEVKATAPANAEDPSYETESVTPALLQL